MEKDFDGAFAALRKVLKRHSRGMTVLADTPTEFTVLTRAVDHHGKPLWFGCVSLKKSAVTYHLFPLYFNPKLQAQVPPELLRRKQGKTCFNFQRPDAELFARLDTLTALGRAHFERAGLLTPGSSERFAAALRAGGEDPAALAKLRKAKGQAAAKKRAATIKQQQTAKRAGKSATATPAKPRPPRAGAKKR